MNRYPQAWEQRVDLCASPQRLEVSGLSVDVTVEIEQVRNVFLPLVHLLKERQRGSGERLVAGLAGIPGSGKSTFAAIMQRVADQVLGQDLFRAVGMDGWHWPNAVLDERTTTDAEGRTISLRRRKGGPESFDVVAMAEAIRRLKSDRSMTRLPAYDRRLHEPVPNALQVPAATCIVLIEGNFLLCDQPPWDRVFHLLDPKLLLEADPQTAGRRVIERHIRGGTDPSQAETKYRRNDAINTQVVLQSAAQAEILVRADWRNLQASQRAG
jgi:hypothetical protein